MGYIFTEEQEKWFLENQGGRYRQELADLMNKEFGTNYTAKQIKELRHRLKVSSGFIGIKKGDFFPNSGMFKKGHIPYNVLPVGAQVVKDDGYLWEKIAKPNKWKQVHIILWESVHGPIPKGSKIIFLNGDIMDIRLENLEILTNAENMVMNFSKLRYQQEELTKSGINVAKLLLAVSRKKKGSVKK